MKKKELPSLFEIFQLGDRVKRSYTDKDGNIQVYSGIIMDIYPDSINVFWDKVDDRYILNYFENVFKKLTINDIFNGSNNYSPIKKEEYIFKDIIRILFRGL